MRRLAPELIPYAELFAKGMTVEAVSTLLGADLTSAYHAKKALAEWCAPDVGDYKGEIREGDENHEGLWLSRLPDGFLADFDEKHFCVVLNSRLVAMAAEPKTEPKPTEPTLTDEQRALVENHQDLVIWAVRKYAKKRRDVEHEIESGALEALICAAQNYSADGGASFKTFAEKCIQNRCFDELRKRRPLSYDATNSKGEEFIEVIEKADERPDPEEQVQERAYDVMDILNPLERRVVSMYNGLDGEDSARFAQIGKPSEPPS